MSQNGLHWIRSAGGPLVLLQESTLPLWQGVWGTDYEDAGAIRGYTGILRRGGKDVLVLADEPLETAHYGVENDQFLIQWSYAPDAESVASVLHPMLETACENLAHAELCITDPRQIVMDAGAPGLNPPDQIVLRLTPGSYVVKTFAYRPATDIELIVHQLMRR
jgi:Immunity protein 21